MLAERVAPPVAASSAHRRKRPADGPLLETAMGRRGSNGRREREALCHEGVVLEWERWRWMVWAWFGEGFGLSRT